MSRPQFPVNTQASVTPGQIVNGGLIDFQDNFHRGMAESYASFMNAQQQQHALAAPGGNPFPIQPYQPPGMQVLQGPAGGQFACISGPPAYFHVNGQTYVPVDAQQPVTVASTPKPVEAPAAETARVYTEEDVERRARDKVEEWAASKLKSYRSDSEPRKPAVKARVSADFDRAAERINSVNAGMRGRYNSPF